MTIDEVSDIPLKFVVYWPGNDVVACADHLQKLIAVGAAMGFSVSYSLAPIEAVCSNCENEAKRKP